MNKLLFLFIFSSTLVLAQIPDRLIQDAELVACKYKISPESEDTIFVFCFDNKLFSGSAIGYMHNYLSIKEYSSGLLSYYMIYDKYGNELGDQGFDAYGDEIPTWGNIDACEEEEPLVYFEYWDNGNIKEHGIRYCSENLFFKSEYYENGKVRKVSYFPPTQIYLRQHQGKELMIDTSIIFDENSNVILQTD